MPAGAWLESVLPPQYQVPLLNGWPFTAELPAPNELADVVRHGAALVRASWLQWPSTHCTAIVPDGQCRRHDDGTLRIGRKSPGNSFWLLNS